jgi:hypothetical protein
VIGKTAGELEDGLSGRLIADQFPVALPTNFNAREEIGF